MSTNISEKQLLGFPLVESFAGRTLVFNNRPPTAGASGGAQEVIEAVSLTWWIGPKGPEPVADDTWDAMSRLSKTLLTLETDSSREEKANYDVLTFPAPEVLQNRQYKTIANEILWPIAHSMQPTLAADVHYEDIEDAYWNGYIQFNELGANAIQGMIREHMLTAQDRIWVHDYQCDNVPGAIYTRHIPFPALEFLESVSFPKRDGSGNVPLLHTNFFRDIMELSVNRALMTFQRADDQINYIMALAAVANEAGQVTIESDNPALQNLVEDVKDRGKREIIRAALKDEIKFVSACRINAFGGKVMLANLPVGQETANTHAIAQVNERKLNRTQFSIVKETDVEKNPHLRQIAGEYKIFNASLGNGEFANLTASKPEDFKHRRPLLKDLLKPIEGRDWVFNVHRNDYTKGTLTKLEAAEELFRENSEMAEKTTFLFVLQPTREDIPAYKEYAEKVFAKAKALREQYGEKSVVIIPEAVKHDDILGLMRRKEVKGFMGLGLKDGHDLTVREAIDANDFGKALGVIVSEGIGAVDVVGQGDNGEKAAFAIKDPTDPHEVKEALKQILDPTQEEAIKARFNVMKQRSAKYNAEHFEQVLNTLYPQAMHYRFGENLEHQAFDDVFEQLFKHPIGEYPKRNARETIEPRDGDGTTTRRDARYVEDILASKEPINVILEKSSATLDQHAASSAKKMTKWAEKHARDNGNTKPAGLAEAKERLWENLVGASSRNKGPLR